MPRLAADSDFYLRPVFRSKIFLPNLLILTMLLIFSVFIAVKGWNNVSGYAVAWIAFGMLWVISLFRLLMRSHESLRTLLATAGVEVTEKESLLSRSICIASEVSNRAMLFSSFAVFGMLMAIALILFRR